MLKSDSVNVEINDLPSDIKSTIQQARLQSIYNIRFSEETDKNSRNKGSYLILLFSDFVTPYALEFLQKLNSKSGYIVSIQQPTEQPNPLGKGRSIEIEIIVSKE